MLLVVVVGACFAPLALLAGSFARWWAARSWDYRERWSGIWAFAVTLGAIYALVLWRADSLPFLLGTTLRSLRDQAWGQAGYSIAELWLLNMLLFPMLALILEGICPRTQRVRVQPRRLPSPRGSQAGDTQSAVGTHEPVPEPLGTYLGGDLHSWVHADVLLYPADELRRHGIVVGEPGFGKTETTLRIATIAARYGWQVIYIDLKGSYHTASRFVAALSQEGVGGIKVFPATPYDGWRGDERALYNRLMAMLDPGTHPYYRQVTSSAIALALGAPTGVPRSSKQFLARLDEAWLKRAYTGRPESRVVNKLSHSELAGVFHSYSGFFRAANEGLDGGFAFEDADAAYLLLDGISLGEETATIGRYLIEDCAHYAVYRKRTARQTLVIVDEFGSLEATNATKLFEKVREFTTTVLVTAQSYEALGPDAESILDSAGIKILHRCGNPEKLVAYAGTREEPTFDYSFDEEGVTGSGKMRMHRVFRVQPDEVRQLPVGGCCLMTGGASARVQVYPLSLPPDLLKAADEVVHTQSPRPSAPPPPQTAYHQAVKRAPKPLQGKTVQPRGEGSSMKPAPQSRQLPPAAKQGAKPADQKPGEQGNLPPLTDFFA